MISTSKPVSCEAQQLSSETIRLKLLQRPVPPHPLFRFSVSIYNLSSSLSGQTPRLNNLNRASIGASSLGGHLIALKVDIGFFFFPQYLWIGSSSVHSFAPPGGFFCFRCCSAAGRVPIGAKEGRTKVESYSIGPPSAELRQA
jgi:hypothetical protein